VDSNISPAGTLSFANFHPALERQGARRAGLFSVAPVGAKKPDPGHKAWVSFKILASPEGRSELSTKPRAEQGSNLHCQECPKDKKTATTLRLRDWGLNELLQ
jgi:hypothetical protein